MSTGRDATVQRGDMTVEEIIGRLRSLAEFTKPHRLGTGENIPWRIACREAADLLALSATAPSDRNAIIEECAKVCDEMAAARYEHARGPFQLCAKNIRSIKDKT